MPRYFFDTGDSTYERDDQGTELSDHAAARRHAIIFAGAVLHREPDILEDGRVLTVKVRDRNRMLIFTVLAVTTEAAPHDEIVYV